MTEHVTEKASLAPVTPHLLARGLDIPVLNVNPLPDYGYDRLDYGMTISLERTPGGRLWACWVAGGDSEKGFFLLASSDDDGATWSDPRLVIDPHDEALPVARRTLVGTLWCDPKGRLWLFFDQALGYFDGRAGLWTTRCDNPDAGIPEWSLPVRITDGCTLNKPIVCANGDWLLPVSLWDRGRISPPFEQCFAELDPLRGAHVFASTDQGECWEDRGMVVMPEPQFDEHHLVERCDGSVWMTARTAIGLHESTSHDGGRTWSAPVPSRISQLVASYDGKSPKGNSSRHHLRRLQSGRLLLVKHGECIDAAPPSRSHLCAFLSDDDGVTWRGGLLLDERGQISYPDGTQGPDGTIYISYDFNRVTAGQILLARFTEEDILAGRAVTSTARLRSLICRPGRLTAPIAPAQAGEWAGGCRRDAGQDRVAVVFDGFTPDKMVCDTTLRELPDGRWVLFMLAGGDTEPVPENYTAVITSGDQGHTWSVPQLFDTGFPRAGKTIGQGPTELMIIDGRCTLFFSTHSHHWRNDWQSWCMHSDDAGATWSGARPMPGRLRYRTFIRNHVVTRDGRIMVPFQHYEGPLAEAGRPPLERALTNPRNGVLISHDRGRTWSEHGDIRLTDNDQYFGWAENNIVELADGRIAMIIRADNLGGVLYGAESTDGGVTWPAFAHRTEIPNPGSKATLYGLGGDTVALLHNPNARHRSPMGLWVSFDGMRTWPYRRVLVPQSCDGPTGRMNYPDGFVSRDGRYLHFAFDDNRHRAVYVRAALPDQSEIASPGAG